jgi:hypothetical protein
MGDLTTIWRSGSTMPVSSTSTWISPRSTAPTLYGRSLALSASAEEQARARRAAGTTAAMRRIRASSDGNARGSRLPTLRAAARFRAGPGQ